MLNKCFLANSGAALVLPLGPDSPRLQAWPHVQSRACQALEQGCGRRRGEEPCTQANHYQVKAEAVGDAGVLSVLSLPRARPQALPWSLPGRPGASHCCKAPEPRREKAPHGNLFDSEMLTREKAPAAALAVTTSLWNGHTGNCSRDRDKGQVF